MNRPAASFRFALVSGLFGCFVLVPAAACKKAPPPPPAPAPVQAKAPEPPPPPLPRIDCPDATNFLPYLVDTGPEPAVEPGKKPAPKKKAGKNAARTLRTDCVVFSPGRFWLAAVLTYDEKTGKNARLGLVSGSPGARQMLFDVTPLPAEPVEKLLKESKETGVKIRKTRADTALVRMGITGGPGNGKPDSQEIGFLLQLVAHKPPQILWSGPGDQVVTDADGCVREQLVDFELLFRTRLERFNTAQIRPDASGKVPPTCKSDGPSTQDSMAVSPVPLGRGRVFGEPVAEPGATTPPAPTKKL